MAIHDIVVCVHNNPLVVESCIESVVLNWNPAFDRSLIIVDDDSDIETKRVLQRLGNTYKFIDVQPTKSRSYYTKAANLGLEKSSANFVTLLNSDTVVTAEWQRKIIKKFDLYQEIGIVGPLSNAASFQSVPGVEGVGSQTAVNSLPPGVSIDSFAETLETISKEYLFPLVPLVHGFCLTISRNVIDRIGYLDANLFPNGYGEENDFCFRADDAGYLLLIATDCFVFHHKSQSYATSEREKFSKAGMQALVSKFGIKRIERSVEYMRKNPVLDKIRRDVRETWSDFYSI